MLGTVTLVRVRLSHNGATAGWLPEHFYSLEECRGGALIDLGCHPMYLTRLFLGEEAIDVQANFGYITGKEVEDNAVATLSTAAGAVGVVEAGFVNNFSPFTIEIHGTDGTILYGTPDSKLLIRSTKKKNTRMLGLSCRYRRTAQVLLNNGFLTFKKIPLPKKISHMRLN